MKIVLLILLPLLFSSSEAMFIKARHQVRRPTVNHQNRTPRRQSHSPAPINLTPAQLKQSHEAHRDYCRRQMHRNSALSLASLGAAAACSYEAYDILTVPTPVIAHFGDGSHMIPLFALLACVAGSSSIFYGLKALDHRYEYLKSKVTHK